MCMYVLGCVESPGPSLSAALPISLCDSTVTSRHREDKSHLYCTSPKLCDSEASSDDDTCSSSGYESAHYKNKPAPVFYISKHDDDVSTNGSLCNNNNEQEQGEDKNSISRQMAFYSPKSNNSSPQNNTISRELSTPSVSVSKLSSFQKLPRVESENELRPPPAPVLKRMSAVSSTLVPECAPCAGSKGLSRSGSRSSIVAIHLEEAPQLDWRVSSVLHM